MREQRRVWEGAAVAAVVSGAPSTSWVAATRAVGTLAAPGEPGLIRGALVHLAISLAAGELFGATLPRTRSVVWGAVGGLALGWVNVGVIARRRYPAIAALPLVPQLADNAAFGAVFAAVADR